MSLVPASATVNGHTFLVDVIPQGGIVLDFGANRGAFATGMLQRLDIKCFSVEANPTLAGSIPPHPNLKIFNYAICDNDQPVSFHLSSNPESSSLQQSVAGTGSQVTVPGRTLAGFMAENSLEKVDLLKVDIEGAELPMFSAASDETLRRISQITIEFHDFVNAYPTAVVRQIANRLKSVGFAAVQYSRSNMNWLFYQPERCRVGAFGRLYLRHPSRWLRWARLAVGGA